MPSAQAAVCGDVVYNNVHMMMYEADRARREGWIASIDAVAALNPKIVVAGHKSVGALICPGTWRPASSTCGTSPRSPTGAAPPRTSSTECWNSTANATNHTPCGFPPGPRSLGEHERNAVGRSRRMISVKPSRLNRHPMA
jgi:hypothetical protein